MVFFKRSADNIPLDHALYIDQIWSPRIEEWSMMLTWYASFCFSKVTICISFSFTPAPSPPPPHLKMNLSELSPQVKRKWFLLENDFSLDHLPLFLSFLSLLSFCLRLFPRSSFSPICGDSVATFLVKSCIIALFFLLTLVFCTFLVWE